MNNSLKETLIKLGLSDQNSFELYSDRVRDNENIKVLKCKKSQVIVLDTTRQNIKNVYESRQGFDYWNQDWNKEARKIDPKKSTFTEDDLRRAELLKPLVRNKNLLDFGTGMGGILRILEKDLNLCHGLELQSGPREYLNKQNISCFKDIDECSDEAYDFITLFHVMEHLDQPIEILSKLKTKLKPKGKMIIEVPHARDALLSIFHSESFKKHTLWSEHLILHTKESLKKFVEAAGMEVQSIKGIQRYPVSNHLHWLSKDLPGGQAQWSFLNSQRLNEEYESILAANDVTDTLIAFCS
ncbi:MAG: class I SAM-dependent methyltransferase [Bacteriovoracaceae bacterium]